MVVDVLEFVARKLVDHPDAVDITIVEEEDDDGEVIEGQVLLELRVHEEDMGKVIGKRGKTAKAIRTMVKAAATREGTSATVEIVE